MTLFSSQLQEQWFSEFVPQLSEHPQTEESQSSQELQLQLLQELQELQASQGLQELHPQEQSEYPQVF
jgi:hypothetical protein